ncbi:hypothetical protein ACFOW1_01595 [Parasediminibacterium paludis]|uniref:Tail protein n=1 Tax=Parasediminibacterium paludis TaxID=908966 RepID=A0ABV8PTK5_9BACT
MLRLLSNNIPIDLAKGSAVELQRQSPLFYLSESSGEYTMPVTIAYSANNVALIGDRYFQYPIKTQLRLAVDVYDGLTYKYSCTLVINKSNINERFKSKSTLEGFLLGGISVFALQAKNVLMKDLKFGGTRTIVNCYTHLKDTWNYTYDYIAAPIQNNEWLATTFDGIMNSLDSDGNFKTNQPIAIQPKLSYVLTAIFSEFGWKLDTTNLSGTDWEKLVVFNAAAFTPNGTTLSLNLADCFDKDLLVIDFVVAICLRYGWTLLPNNAAKTVTLVALKTVGLGAYKDVTAYAASELASDYSAGEIVYGFKNTLPSNDAAVSNPEFTNWLFLSPVNTIADLPSGDLSSYYNVLVYVFSENKYYKVDGTAWVVFTDNIYDYEPTIPRVTGLNTAPTIKNIETACSTLPVYKVQYRSNGGTDYYAHLPYCKQKNSEKWGIRTLLYLGLCDETLADGTTIGAIQYPMLSNLCVDNLGNFKAQWSNVFKHINPIDKTDYGIIAFWHNRWLRSTNTQATETTTLSLPLYELANINFETPLLINSISYILTQIVEPIPFLNKIQVTLKRYLLPQEIPVAPPNGTIYLRLVFDAEETIAYDADLPAYQQVAAPSSAPITEYKVKRLKIYAFADAAATIPFRAVNLLVSITRYYTYTPGLGYTDSDATFVERMNGTSQQFTYFQDDVTLPDGTIVTDKTRSLQVYASNGLTIENTYALAPSAAYVII